MLIGAVTGEALPDRHTPPPIIRQSKERNLSAATPSQPGRSRPNPDPSKPDSETQSTLSEGGYLSYLNNLSAANPQPTETGPTEEGDGVPIPSEEGTASTFVEQFGLPIEVLEEDIARRPRGGTEQEESGGESEPDRYIDPNEGPVAYRSNFPKFTPLQTA